MRVLLGLGSNLGDREAHLAAAVRDLRQLDPDLLVSSLYETDPVGGPAQGPYLNCVVRLDTGKSPRELLELCRSLEADAGRVRTAYHGPRTLDADVLLVGELRVDEPDLVVPHPRMWGRRFVVCPLAELAPELVPAEVLAAAGGTVRRLGRISDVEI